MKRQAILCIAILLLAASNLHAQMKAFPQAEGAGASALGGRGGYVYHVTSLADTNTPGTLRYGVTSYLPNQPITVVFDVGGWINLSSNLGVTRSRVTIAGQTAPGGIGVRGGKFSVGGDDIVVRHMRFKPGKGSGRNDSVNTNNEAERVIYDHISAGYSWDENFSVQATDVTLQYSTVSFGLEDHSAGSLLENPHRLTMHHNLYAHNDTRNPKHRVQETLDWVNNVIYNWDDRAFYMEGTSSTGYFWTSNIDGNYFIAGPNQDNTKPLSGGSVDDYGTYWGTNAYDADGDAVHDGRDYVRTDRDFGDVSSALTTWSNTPYPVADPVWKDASTQAAYERVLSQFGATPWDRDEVDTLLHQQVVNRSGSIISHENELVALGVTNAGFGTLGGGAAPLDTDRDGMPDWWEQKHNTPVNRPSNNGDFDRDGYTDLEEYLNDVAAFPAPGPILFTGADRYADPDYWAHRWNPTRFDEVHINFNTAVVDAVGQHAGRLKIGNQANAHGILEVTAGWLEVAEEVMIGVNPAATATLNLQGGILATPKLSRAANGTFNFTGGTLHAAEVTFDLTNNGGTLAPGQSSLLAPGQQIGTTEVAGDLTLAAGTLAIDLASTLIADALVVDGTATLGGLLSVNQLAGFTPQVGNSWQILSAGSLVGNFSSVTAGYSVQKVGGSLLLTYNGAGSGSAIPEPASVWLLLAGLLLAVRMCR